MQEQEKTTLNRRSHLDSRGNWCGHDPENPRYYEPPEDHGIRPDVLVEAQDNLILFYETPKKFLPSLHVVRETMRQERTEGREADSSILQLLLHYTDLVSLRAGVPLETGSFLPLSVQFVAEKLNLSLKRVLRALSRLKKAGYLIVHQRYKKGENGENDYTGLVAIKCLTVKLFNELGISPAKLELRRKKAAARLKKMCRDFKDKVQEEVNKHGVDAIKALVESVTNNTYNKGNFDYHDYKLRKEAAFEKKKQESLEKVKRHAENRAKTLNKRLSELMKIPINHGKSRADVIAENPELASLPGIEDFLKRS
jgi:Mn-dependent DtxR family transcriptional regulator